MNRGNHPRMRFHRIIGTLLVVILLFLVPFLSIPSGSQDPKTEDAQPFQPGVRTARWLFENQSNYTTHDVNFTSEGLKLKIENGSYYNNDFNSGVEFNHTTIKNGEISLIGNENDLIANGSFSSKDPWEYTNSSDGNITARWNNTSNRGEFFYENSTIGPLKQFESFNSTNLSRWWGIGQEEPTLLNSTSDKQEGLSALEINWTGLNNWVEVFRDDERTWNWSQYSNLTLGAKRKPGGFDGANMSIFLQDNSNSWFSPNSPMHKVSSNLWLNFTYNITSPSYIDLSRIDRLGVVFQDRPWEVNYSIDNITLSKQFDNMDDVGDWKEGSNVSLDPMIINTANKDEGIGSLQILWYATDPSHWAACSNWLGGPWNWASYSNLRISIDTDFSGVGLNMSIYLYNGTKVWNSTAIDINNSWNKYYFDISNALDGDLSNISKIVIFFTGADTTTAVYIDDIQLYKQFDNMDYAWTPSPWRPTGNAPPGLDYNTSVWHDTPSSLKLWWNPFGVSTKSATIYHNLTSDEDWSKFNRLKLWANQTTTGSNAVMSLDLYSSASNWSSSESFNLVNGWNEYIFDLSAVNKNILSAIRRIELNFTGANSKTIIYVDDIQLEYYKILNQTAYINQTFEKNIATDKTSTHVYLKFNYTIENCTNIGESDIGVWINNENIWNLNLTSTTIKTEIFMDVSNNMSAKGNYSISFRFHMMVDTTKELGFKVAFDDVSIKALNYMNGFFISKELDFSKGVIWKSISWSQILPPDTNITVEVRRANSSSQLPFANWCGPFGNSILSSIEGSDSSWIQYRVNLTTLNASRTPRFIQMNFTYQKYYEEGYIETLDFTPEEVAYFEYWGSFKAIWSNSQDTNISYWYSTDSGGQWFELYNNSDLGSILDTTIRFNASFSTEDTAQTPILREISITYKYNLQPEINPAIPNQNYSEDCAPWTLNLWSSAHDDSLKKDLTWEISGVDTTIYNITGNGTKGSHNITISPGANAFGADEVTARLIDPSGRSFTQIFWVNITPVNDAPYFKSQPEDKEVKAEQDYSIDYRDIIADIDNDKSEITLSTNSQYALVNGFRVTYRFPATMANKDAYIILTISDGDKQNSTGIMVTVKPSSSTLTSSWDLLSLPSLAILGAIALIVATLIAISMIRRRKQQHVLDDLFLVHRDGRLIAHYTRQLQANRDEDILSGMLTAVQEFIKDSMGRDTELKKFEFQDKQVMFEKGENLYAAVFLGAKEPQNAREQLTAFIEDIEEAYSDVLPQWTGEIEAFKGLQDIMDRLFVGRGYQKGYWKKLKFLDEKNNRKNLKEY